MEKSISLTLKIIGILLGILLLYLVRNLIAYLLLSFVFASALRPGVDWFQKRKIPRFLGGFFLFLFLLILLGLVIYFAFPPLINEIQAFTSVVPQYWQTFLVWLPRFEAWLQTTPLGGNIREAINQSIQKLSQTITSLIIFISGLFGKLLNLALIIVLTFYLTVEEKISDKISPFLIIKDKKKKTNAQEKISQYWKLAEEQVGRWLQGYIFLGFIVGILVYIGLTILGVRYSLILAFLTGVLEIIPLLGPVASALTGLLLALLQGGWIMAFWTTFVFFVVQQIEHFIVVPFVMKKKVDLNPLFTLIVLFIGGRLGGALGMVLAVPMGAILVTFLKEGEKSDKS